MGLAVHSLNGLDPSIHGAPSPFHLGSTTALLGLQMPTWNGLATPHEPYGEARMPSPTSKASSARADSANRVIRSPQLLLRCPS